MGGRSVGAVTAIRHRAGLLAVGNVEHALCGVPVVGCFQRVEFRHGHCVEFGGRGVLGKFTFEFKR